MTNWPGQLLELIESPCQFTATAPPQLSLVTTLLVSGAGTWLAQFTVRFAGQVRLGAVVSMRAIVWLHVLLLPALSVATHVRVVTKGFAQPRCGRASRCLMRPSTQ